MGIRTAGGALCSDAPKARLAAARHRCAARGAADFCMNHPMSAAQLSKREKRACASRDGATNRVTPILRAGIHDLIRVKAQALRTG
jgi:hypothetical protein